MHFGFIDVILLHSDHQQVLATHVTIFRVVRTSVCVCVCVYMRVHVCMETINCGCVESLSTDSDNKTN